MNYGMFTKEQLWDTMGRPYTKALFREFGGEGAPLSLSKHEQDGCINLRHIYISHCVDDPTELMFAEAVFGDWEYWDHLRQVKWMAEQVAKWREVVEVKRKARAFSTIIEDASDPKSRSKVSSAKYLIEEPWKGKTKAVRKAVEETTTQAHGQVRHDIERMKEHLQ